MSESAHAPPRSSPNTAAQGNHGVSRDPRDATASYLGFVFQGHFALLLLLRGRDGDSVAVESDDDVVLEGANATLAQLKHSLADPPALTIKNVGLWKALGGWAAHVAQEASRPHVAGRRPTRYWFVTNAGIPSDDPLTGLMARADAPDHQPDEQTRRAVLDALVHEATRVARQRGDAASDGSRQPHAERAAACAAFLALSPPQRDLLVRGLVVFPRNFRITDVPALVIEQIHNALPAPLRAHAAERVIEWWDRQVVLSLIGQRRKAIHKEELLLAINTVIREQRPSALPDDYSFRAPAAGDLEAERGGYIEQQILLVRGGHARVMRALEARWRARGQRHRWLENDVSLGPVLDAHRERLRRAWAERHGPMCEDCADLPEDQVCAAGKRLLDWSHEAAHHDVTPPRPDWQEPFYTQGTLQQLADELVIGWHPAFAERLRGTERLEAEPPAEMPAGKRPRGRRTHESPPAKATSEASMTEVSVTETRAVTDAVSLANTAARRQPSAAARSATSDSADVTSRGTGDPMADSRRPRRRESVRRPVDDTR